MRAVLSPTPNPTPDRTKPPARPHQARVMPGGSHLARWTLLTPGRSNRVTTCRRWYCASADDRFIAYARTARDARTQAVPQITSDRANVERLSMAFCLPRLLSSTTQG